jgi:hypothetical protein
MENDISLADIRKESRLKENCASLGVGTLEDGYVKANPLPRVPARNLTPASLRCTQPSSAPQQTKL